jgi:hypothetical protein
MRGLLRKSSRFVISFTDKRVTSYFFFSIHIVLPSGTFVNSVKVAARENNF